MIRIALKIILPLLIVAAAGAGAYAIVLAAPEVQPRPQEEFIPVVHTMVANPTDVRLDVEAYGTVRPRTQITIVPQVSGRVESIAPTLRQGAFFKKDEVLVRIEQRDYKLAVTQAEAVVAQAQARLDSEEAEAEIAKKEWEAFGKGEPNALVLRKPQLAEAKATLASAKAQLAGAELALGRTEIRAPFDGRVRSESVDIGQFLVAGAPMANVYSTDFAEVRLSIPNHELPFVELPLDERGNELPEIGVILTADFAGKEYEWKGVIARTEAELDPQSRALITLARVERPYESRVEGQPPLMVGTYVRALIGGKVAEAVFVLPASVLRPGRMIWVIDEESRLRIRPVKILKRVGSDVVIEEGLKAGERICTTPLEPAIDGMSVRVEEREAEK
jgi:RND family efflux transporter MFP subunit